MLWETQPRTSDAQFEFGFYDKQMHEKLVTVSALQVKHFPSYSIKTPAVYSVTLWLDSCCLLMCHGAPGTFTVLLR